ncbi:MAG: alanine:cation symporter family protein [Salinicola sp.]|uniref:alanine/glycine:cation symporter family protein n=1 Tax=Salinicola sp. TaxID=1978524 RepID=UPI001D4F9153|nr:alanine/glycine:cation symporter family protein [Salinicola sp.]NRB54460.1 alanine:cation symporter family protein [Salinicola sp.]
MLDLLNELLWGKLLLVLLVAVGIGFTVASRGVQFRYFGRMFRVLGSGQAFKREQNGHLSSFQALVLSVAGRVGGGNIAGVAVAITLGGPGAIFWMWLVGLMGMATSFLECTLAQTYKQAEGDGTYRGGPAYYITRGLGPRWKWLANVYAVLLLLTFGLAFTGVQSYAAATSLADAFGFPVLASGITLAVIVGLIIFGGIKRIVRISDLVVPVMAVGYLLVTLVVLVMNVDKLPGVIALIFHSAFGLEPAVGGGIGAAIMMGLKRGLFSNEAGLGSAPNVAAVAYVPHPVNQGIVQAFSVFIDTLLICSCTAFLILLSGVYAPGMDSDLSVVALTQAAMAEHVGAWGRSFVSVALLLFVFSSILYNYYLGENSLYYFSPNNRLLTTLYRGFVVILVGWSATRDLSSVFGFADVTMGLLAVANLVALILLFKPGLAILKDYDDQVRQGIDQPIFDVRQHPGLDLDLKSWEIEPGDIGVAQQGMKGDSALPDG